VVETKAEPVVAKEVPVKQEQPVTDTKNKVDPKTFTNHSGGAKGYDAEWDIIGAEFGFINNNHYLLPVDGSVADPRLKAKGVKPVDATKDIGQVAATGPAIGEAQIAVTKAERAMGRIEKNYTTRNTKKIRNYAQVKNADGIFAIGSLIPKGADITIAQGKETRVALVPQVNGGTSVAVQLSITMGKPTYVFNQVANSTYAEGWYKWSKAKQDFIPVDTPVLTKNFAGIGTSSNTTPQGKQAIRDVYAKTLKAAKAEPQLDITTPVEATTAEGTTDVSEAPNTKETQTSDDAEALIEALETEAKKRVTLEDEDTLESEALSELVSLAYGNAITEEDLKTVKELFGEDLVNEALRIKSLPLGKKEEAQNYLETVRNVLGDWIKVKAYIEDVTLEELETYKKKILELLEKRKQNTANVSKIFDVLTAYVTKNQTATPQPETKGETTDSVQENKPTHNVPKNILNKLLTAKHIVGDLLGVSNGVFNTKEAKYAVDLLTALIGLKDSVIVMLSDNIAVLNEDGTYENKTINKVTQSKMSKNNIGRAEGNKIYIKLNHDAPIDTFRY